MNLTSYKRRNLGMFEKLIGDFFDSDFFYTDNVTKNFMSKDSENDVTYECVVAGIEKENVKVEYKNGYIFVKAQQDNRSYKYSFNIPENCDYENINGKITNGILTLTIPKIVKEEPKGKSINIE